MEFPQICKQNVPFLLFHSFDHWLYALVQYLFICWYRHDFNAPRDDIKKKKKFDLNS